MQAGFVVNLVPVSDQEVIITVYYFVGDRSRTLFMRAQELPQEVSRPGSYAANLARQVIGYSPILAVMTDS